MKEINTTYTNKTCRKKTGDVERKCLILHVVIRKISGIETKVLDISGFVKKTDYDAKISGTEKEYFTTADYNRFTSEPLDAKIKEKEIVNKSDISNLVKNSDLNTKLSTLATKAELKVEANKNCKTENT